MSTTLELVPQFETSVFSGGSFLYEGIARRGSGIAELEESASRLSGPKRIITADCSDPREIDDGYSVRPLPSAREVYQVDVCIADATSLYKRTNVLQQAMLLTRAEYFPLGDGEQAYEPMIPERHVREKELAKAALKKALVISFVVGDRVPPSDLHIAFEEVEVATNYNYKQFSQMSSKGLKLEKYANAANYIKQGLRYNPGGDKTHLIEQPVDEGRAAKFGSWKHGSRLNEAFMVASNHLVGKMMRDEDRAAIYRLHGNAADVHAEILRENVAWFSQEPGLHQGLGLEPYCPSTSPLRRLQDLIMHYHLWLRDQNLNPTPHDMEIMKQAIINLNTRAIYDSVARARARSKNGLVLLPLADEAVA